MITIQSIINDVIEAMRVELGTDSPYYEFGRIETIANRLIEKSNNSTQRNKIFPLICLVQDYKEKRGDGLITATVNILFAVETTPTKSNKDRYADTFPTAYSLRDSFNKHLGRSASTEFSYPEFKQIDHSYYTGNQNIFSSFSDVIAFEYELQCADSTSIPYVEPTTVTATITSGEGGTTSPAPDVYTRSLNENNGYYAIAEAGYKFSQWLKDGIVRLTNPIAILADSTYTLVAEFVVSSIKQLTIAVSGNGTTSPAPDDYDIESGESQLITAIENDSDYIFHHFNQDGTEYTTNPKSFTVIENSLVVAYFIIKWTQWVFNNVVSKTLGLTYFIDRSPNANNVQVKNIQVGNFYDTSIYLQFVSLTGIEIESYNGVFVPEKSGNTIIITTLGLAYDLTLDNGMKATFNEGIKDEIHFTDNAGNVLIATLENVVLDTFWNTKSELGTSGIHLNGNSKYFVCESAGTSIILGEPDGSNLGAELVTNGNMENGGIVGSTLPSSWYIYSIPEIAYKSDVKVLSGSYSIYCKGTIGKGVYNFTASVIAGRLYKISVKIYVVNGIVQLRRENPSIMDVNKLSTTTGQWESMDLFTIANGTGLSQIKFISYFGETEFYIDEFTVKEVTDISLLSTFKFKLKPTICDTYWLNSNDITTGNGYMYRQTPIASTLFRVDAGVLTQLSTAAITYTDYQDVEPTFSETGIAVNVNDIEILTSTDTAYPTFKGLVFNNSVGDEISHVSKGTLAYDLDDACCGTGTYAVQKVIGKTTLLDAKGNTLEIPANVISNSGNTYDGIEGLADDATYEQIYDATFDEETKTAYKEMGYVTEIKVL